MNLKTVKVLIANQRVGQPKNEQAYEIRIPEHSIEEMHGVISRMWPDCQVTFKWWGKNQHSWASNCDDCFIYGSPVNQKIDELYVEDGYMSHSDYTKKWYGF